MALDPRFVVAPSLEMYFVDKDTGLPLAGGIVTFYSDQNRSQLKPVYELSGSPPNYTYTQLPNPVILSGVGTFEDGSGNNILPYYFPYDGTPTTSTGQVELYYITVESSGSVPQFTREGWPNITGNTSGGGSAFEQSNYVINNVFERNIGQTANPIANGAVLAPGAHSAFQFSDITFQRNGGTATDQITFTQFGQGSTPLSPDLTPQYYLNYNCTNTPTGEVSKEIRIPLQPKVKTMEGQQFTFDIWAQGVSGTQAISVFILQYFGDGGSPSTAVSTQVGTGSIALSTSWEQYSGSVIIPSTAGKILGTCGNDGTYLSIRFPINLPCQINLTKPKFYIGSFIADLVDFETTDQINSVLDTVRTADVRTTYNNFSSNPQVGWVPMNDGTIGSATSLATTRANIDTFFLYKTLWENVSNTYAPVTGGRGANAIADYSANKALQLTRMLGRVMAGVISPQVTQTFTVVPVTTIMTLPNTDHFYTGAPIRITSSGTLPSPIVALKTYYSRLLSATTLSAHPTAEDAIANTNAISFTTAGTGILSVTVASRELGEFLGKEFMAVGDLPSPIPHKYMLFTGGGTMGGPTNGSLARGNALDPTTIPLDPDFNFIDIPNANSNTGLMQPTTYVNVFIKL